MEQDCSWGLIPGLSGNNKQRLTPMSCSMSGSDLCNAEFKTKVKLFDAVNMVINSHNCVFSLGHIWVDNNRDCVTLPALYKCLTCNVRLTETVQKPLTDINPTKVLFLCLTKQTRDRIQRLSKFFHKLQPWHLNKCTQSQLGFLISFKDKAGFKAKHDCCIITGMQHKWNCPDQCQNHVFQSTFLASLVSMGFTWQTVTYHREERPKHWSLLSQHPSAGHISHTGQLEGLPS